MNRVNSRNDLVVTMTALNIVMGIIIIIIIIIIVYSTNVLIQVATR